MFTPLRRFDAVKNRASSMTPRAPRSPSAASGARRRAWLAVLSCSFAAATACAACGTRSTNPTSGGAPHETQTPAKQQRQVVDLFAFGRVLGTVAPCGCTTEPLGGVQYAFGYIESRSTPASRLVIEPGSLLFPDPAGGEAPTDEASWAQAEQRASLLTNRLGALGDGLVSGVGPFDVSSSEGLKALERWALPRVVANAPKLAELGLPGHRVAKVGDPALTIGVTAVLSPEFAKSAVLGPLDSPVEALKREVSSMKSAGADLTVAIAHGPSSLAESLADANTGVDIIVVAIPVGLERSRVGKPVGRRGSAWILEPGEKLQSVTHLRLEIDRKAAPEGLPPATEWERRTPTSARARELERLDKKLEGLRGDVAADPNFVARLEREREQLVSAIENPPAPKAAVAATFEQVKITCHLEVDAPAKEALASYDGALAQQNRERFTGVRPPEPAPGEPSYVGVEECANCHTEAHEQWLTTRHAGAYKTLTDANKEFDLTCVGCHVTGFREPGGAEVVENAELQSVQCEQCHGPGSVHAEEPEKHGKPNAITLHTPKTVCDGCHTPEHSDTFEYAAYLRDIVGEGHGPEARAKLGDGPTGRALRQAGFEKAGGSCMKH